MRCSALALALLLVSGAAGAQDPAPAPPPPADAPLAPAVPLQKGEMAPEPGVFMTAAKAADVAYRCRLAEVERDQMKQSMEADPGIPKNGLVLVAVTFVVGLVAGGAVVWAVKKH